MEEEIYIDVHPSVAKFLPELREKLKKIAKEITFTVNTVIDRAGMRKDFEEAQKELIKNAKPVKMPVQADPVKSGRPATGPPVDQSEKAAERAAKKAADEAEKLARQKARDQKKLDKDHAEALALERRHQEKLSAEKLKAQQELDGAQAKARQDQERANRNDPINSSLREDASNRLKKVAKLSLDIDDADVRAELQSAITKAQESVNTQIPLGANGDKARKDIEQLIREIEGSQAVLEAQASTAAATTQMRYLTRPRVVSIVAKADQAAIVGVGAALARISGARVASNAVEGLGRRLSNLDKSTPKIATVSTAIGGLGSTALSAVGSVASLGSSVAALGGVAGLLPGLLGAAGAGIGTLLASFHGVGEALGAISDAKKEAAAAPTTDPRIEAIQTQQAQQSIAVAYEDAAEARVQSAEAVRDAEESLGEAITAARDNEAAAAERLNRVRRDEEDAARVTEKAQTALNEAYATARERLSDLNSEVSKSKLDQRDAAAKMQEAIDAFNQAKTDPSLSGSAKRALKLERDKAIQANTDAQKNVKELAKEQAEASRKGVKGSDEVLDAKERLALAERNERDLVAEKKKIKADAAKQEVADLKTIGKAREQIQDAREAADKSAIAAKSRIVAAEQSLLLMELHRAQEQQSAATVANAAMAALTPHAQEAVRAISKVVDQLGRVRKAAQQNFFKGFAAPLLLMADTLIPELEVGVGRLARQMGLGTQDFMNSLTKNLGGGVLEGMFTRTAQAAGILNGSIEPLTRSLVKIADVGTTFFPQLATGITDMSREFGAFIDRAAADGSLKSWIQGGLDAARDLGSVLKGSFGILGALAKAGTAAGGSTLGTLGDTLNEIARVMNAEPFQSNLILILEGANEALSNMAKSLGPIGTMFNTLAPTLNKVLPILGQVLGTAITGIAKVLGDPALQQGLISMFQGILSGVEALMPAMGPLGQILGSVGGVIGEIARVLGPVLAELLIALAPIVRDLAEALKPMVQELGTVLVDAIGKLAPKLQEITDFLIENKEMVLLAVGAYVLVKGAIAGIKTATAIADIAKLTTAWLLNKNAVKGTKTQTIALMGLYAKDFAVKMAQAVAAIARQTAAWVINAATIVASRIAMVASTIATGLATAAQWLLNAALSANPVGLIVLAVAALIAGIVLLVKNWDTIGPAIGRFVETAGKLIGQFVENTVGMFVDFFHNTVGMFSDWGAGIGKFIAGVVEKIGKWFSNLWNRVVEGIGNFITSARERLGKIGKAIRDSVSGVGEWFAGVWNRLIEGIAGFIGSARDRLSRIGDAVRDAIRGIGGWFADVWRGALDGIGDFIDTAIDWFQELPDRIAQALGSLGQIALDAGKNLMTSLANGIQSVLPGLGGVVGKVMDFIGGWFPRSPAKRGRFSGDGYTDRSGQALIEDYAKGIESRKAAVAKAAEKIQQAVALKKHLNPTISVDERAERGKAIKAQGQRLARQLREDRVTEINNFYENVSARNTLIQKNRLKKKKVA